MSSNPSPAGPSPPASEEPPALPDFVSSPRPWLALDRLGLTQSIGGLILGLIALLSSYDHITFAGHTVPLPQQWGIPCIAASVAIIVIGFVQYSAPLGRDAQLATRSRLRAAEDAARVADETAKERDRADRERNRAAEARERQAESIECLRQAALLSARVQLDPSESNRARLQAFLALIGGAFPGEGQT